MNDLTDNATPSPLHPPATSYKKPKLLRDPALGFILLLVGVTILAFLGFLEDQQTKNAAWTGAFYGIGHDPPWEGTFPIALKRIPLSNFPDLETEYEILAASFDNESLASLGLDMTETLIALDAPIEILQPILASGRLPERGEHEVLAGEFARLESFHLDDVTFSVVGRISRSAGGLTFAYLLPRDDALEELFLESGGAEIGWFDPEGKKHFTEATKNETAPDDLRVRGSALTTPEIILGVIVGLALVALGGALVQIRLFQLLARRASGPLLPACRAIDQWPRLLLFIHLLLYGAFFGFMIAAVVWPVEHFRMRELIAEVFSKGYLATLTQAYGAGNIPLAALLTFANNYGLQTVVMTFLVSIVIPFSGILKTLISFSMTGFGMAPMWLGSAAGYTYHSITLTLELEAYVIACFAVCMWPIQFVKDLMNKSIGPGLLHALKIMASAALLTGVMLAIAALYEATTLILLH